MAGTCTVLNKLIEIPNYNNLSVPSYYGLLNHLIHMLVQINGPIDDHLSNLVVAQLLFLESEDPEKAVRSSRFYRFFCIAEYYNYDFLMWLVGLQLLTW